MRDVHTTNPQPRQGHHGGVDRGRGLKDATTPTVSPSASTPTSPRRVKIAEHRWDRMPTAERGSHLGLQSPPDSIVLGSSLSLVNRWGSTRVVHSGGCTS
jgi:hypothetical protein